ncbi:MAG TPA: hypothetical protein VHV78_02245, partial [Gemmatimonadaceae bacterium]|nr:hypothetical protein [Gemmatimonadaceae bacterium]
TIRATSDPLVRDLYVARTSDAAGVSREALVRELARQPRERSGAEPPSAAQSRDASENTVIRGADRRTGRPRRGARAERELVRALLHHRRFIEPAAERIDAASFADPVYAHIFAELVSGDPEATPDTLSVALDPDAVSALEELIEESGGLDRPEEVVNGSINAITSRQLSTDLGEIDRLLPLADSQEKDRLIARKQRLLAELVALGQSPWKQFNASRS